MVGAFQPQACVIGNMDLIRPLGLAGIRCAVVAQPGATTAFSRFTDAVVEWDGGWKDTHALAEQLVRHAEQQPEPPVLFYQHDEHAMFVSRHADLLSSALRFVIAPPSQLRGMLDKEEFQTLAERLGLPVPPTTILTPWSASRPPSDLPYPVILKPLSRGDGRWREVDPLGKATRVDDVAGLRRLWRTLQELDATILAQQVVPGPESRIESYHVYVDAAGRTAGEFTGRKIRTRPREYGETTALEITDAPEVAALGREIIRKTALPGVAKVDFKRDDQGKLWLLEINPRFNLWHHPGAVAGVNLPALVWADLAGRPRPPTSAARPGVRWCSIKDAAAARDWGVPPTRWLRWALACETKANAALDDPLPIVRRALWKARRRVLGGPVACGSR